MLRYDDVCKVDFGTHINGEGPVSGVKETVVPENRG